MMFRDLYARYDEDKGRPFPPADSRPTTPTLVERRSGIGAILWRRRGTIAASVALCCIAGLLYVLVTPARYLASTSMLIDPRLGKTVGADPVQPGFIVDVGAIDSQIKLFTSQTVLARVAKMADLTDDPEFNGSQRSLLNRILHPASQLEGGVDLKLLEEAITIKRPERTYVVGIEVLAQDPAKAAEIANDLTQAYIEDQVASRIDAAREDTRFVRQQLTKLSAQIKEAEDKVEAFKSKNNVVDTNGLRSNEQQVADLTKALGEARARTSDAQAKLDEIRRMKQQGRLDGAGDALKSITIERLRQQEAEAEENVAKLSSTLGARHPELREAEGRRDRLVGLIRDELSRVAYSAEADYQAARSNERQIEATVDRLKVESTKISTALVPLGQLERNVTVLRGSFERFAQVRDTLSQQEADSPPGRVIAVARPPVSASSPKKSLVALISLVVGLFGGLAAALLGEGVPSPVSTAPAVPDAPRPTPAPAPYGARPTGVPRRYWDDDDTTLG